MKSKNIISVIIPLVVFIAISVLYFSPDMFSKKLLQSDITHYKGMSKEILDFNKETGEQTLWTNSMFGGMPAYQISAIDNNNLFRFVDRFLRILKSPASFIFIAFLGFYILLLAFKVDYKLSTIGALAYGLSSYFLIIIAAGHNTKMIALGYLPGVLAGIVLIYYQRKLILGTVLFSIFLTLEIIANHLQITFYGVILILIYAIFIVVDLIKQKDYNYLVKSGIFVFVGMLLAVGVNFTNLYTTYEYGKESLRGPSELSIDHTNQTSGLDKDYATSWSYGKMETFNLFIPNLVGGASGSELSKKSATYKKLLEVGATKKQANDAIKRMPTYWGPQPFTSGPVYIGALVIFLFVMGIFLVKGPIRTWLLTATLLSIMLAWGKNFMFLTDIFFDYFPGYNKFRTVSMILVIAELTMPLLGILALKNIIEEKVSKEQIIKALKYSVGILSGLALIFIVNPGILDFRGLSDTQLPDYLQDSIIEDRASMMRGDAIRSLIFVLIGASTIWFYIKGKLKSNYLYIIIGLAIVIDLWSVDKRYLNEANFESKHKVETPFTASKADEIILKDGDPNYRVLNLAVSTFNDASTSYFHKSIGGYHGAKLRRYQELIDFEISKEMQNIINTLKKQPTKESLDLVLKNNQALNMLNTKYIIYNPEAPPLVNYYSLGNAWFVSNTKVVANANKEIEAVQNFDPKTTAIVDKRFEKELFDFTKDSNAKIVLTSYKPNHLIYKTEAKTDQLAVFSEIYYEKGWNAYIDGNLAPYFRVNYVLRAMKIPAGNHSIDFKFEPKSWAIGTIIALISSLILLLALIGIIIFEFKQKNKEIE